jgi:hypothetical protein
MANQTPKWSGLGDRAKRDAIQRVIDRAAWDGDFYKKCLDRASVHDTVATEAGVTFDADIEVRCFKDKTDAQKQVLILLAPLVAQSHPPPNPPPPDQAFWMCTYPTYNPDDLRKLLS